MLLNCVMYYCRAGNAYLCFACEKVWQAAEAAAVGANLRRATVQCRQSDTENKCCWRCNSGTFHCLPLLWMVPMLHTYRLPLLPPPLLLLLMQHNYHRPTLKLNENKILK